MDNTNVLPPIKVKAGEHFQIIQEDISASTGYTCALKTMPECVVMLADDFIPPIHTVIGAPGSRRFSFLAVASGRGDINFINIRPFDYKHPVPPGPMQKRSVIVE